MNLDLDPPSSSNIDAEGAFVEIDIFDITTGILLIFDISIGMALITLLIDDNRAYSGVGNFLLT